MHPYGFLSLLPPLVAIVFAILTRQVFVSLLFGIFLGWFIVYDFDFLVGALSTIEALVAVFQDPGNTRTIMFCALVGALIVLIQRSGGVAGFIHFTGRFLEKIGGNKRKWVQFFAWLTGLVIFVESSISILTVGTLYRPLFDQLKIPREKLAYIADSSSAPSSILIPFNGWGAFIMTLLLAQGFSDPFSVMFKSLSYNFYPMLALLMVLVVIFTGKDWGPMAKAEKRTQLTGELMDPESRPMVSDELTSVLPIEGKKHRSLNMVFPILVMVLMMPVMLAYTGWESASVNYKGTDLWGKLIFSLGQGSGSTSVLVSVITSILVTILMYRAQNILSFGEMIQLTLKGTSEMVPLALLMMLAFAIGNICKEMETGKYVADWAQLWLSPRWIPLLIFIISCFIAFSTGTSWGTFAIMIAIAVPMAQTTGANIYLTIAAVLGGGVFGDHCSPISDTTILSSMASSSDHIDHVKTQMPYALICGIGTAILYLLTGLFI